MTFDEKINEIDAAFNGSLEEQLYVINKYGGSAVDHSAEEILIALQEVKETLIQD